MTAVLSKSRSSLDDKTMAVDVRLGTLDPLSAADKARLVGTARDIWRECLPRARSSLNRQRRWVSGRKIRPQKGRPASEKAWLAQRRKQLQKQLQVGKGEGRREPADVIRSAKDASGDAWSEKHEEAPEGGGVISCPTIAAELAALPHCPSKKRGRQPSS